MTSKMHPSLSYNLNKIIILLSLTFFILLFASTVFCMDYNANQTVANTQPVRYVRAVRESLAEYEMYRQQQTHNRRKRATKRVCYNELGCFEDSGPFAYLEMLPSSPTEINTKFYFYSTKNRSDRPLLELPFLNMTEAFRKSRIFNKKRRPNQTEAEEVEMSTESPVTTSTIPTRMSILKKNTITLDDLDGFDQMSVRIIVHGFGSTCSHVWIYEMKTALMAVENCIVICVDWENGATFPNYVRAATNTRLVGKQLAMLIRNLQDYHGLNLSRTHIIGFSLGAHVAGFAGTELPGLARITGLDPAGPLFEAQPPKVRLDNNDAKFVDVIHSNGENLILGGLGAWQPMGDVDFYPNGGRVQTGCSNLFVGAVTDFIWSAQTAEEEEGRSLCNHRRAYKFFIDSVAPRCMFPAFPCTNYDDFLKGKCFRCTKGINADHDKGIEGAAQCGNMGYYADRSSGRGQLYLVTREEEPFCAHQFQLQIFNSFNALPLRTIGRLEAILEGDVGLNETFKISDKDDSEFFAGDIVSKIIVPHPALGYPTTLSLNYKHYIGWLSKGLPHWDIDKVVLTDSFGRSHSICKTSTKLTSGSPVRLKLLPGNCELDNQDEYGYFTSRPTTNPSDATDDETLNSDILSMESVKRNANILKNDNNFMLKEYADRSVLDNQSDLPWQPILNGNFLDKEDVTGSSRSLTSKSEEIFEPILNDRRLTSNKGRNLQDLVTTKEIVEPILKATTPRIRTNTEITSTQNLSSSVDWMQLQSSVKGKNSKTTSTSEMNETITIQLFPFRLGEILQKAERYAREILLPLISIQAPRFFGFNTNQKNETSVPVRKPRYIPRVPTTNQLKIAQYDDRLISRRSDIRVIETNNHKTAFQLMRSMKVPDSSITQNSPSNHVTYYTNTLLTKSRSIQPINPAYEPVFITLPTYRTPTEPLT